MGLNVEDPKVISDALKQAQGAGDEIVDRAAGYITQAESEIAPILAAAINQLGAQLTAALAAGTGDLTALVNSLDGWTLTLDPPIVVKTVRLEKPKG